MCVRYQYYHLYYIGRSRVIAKLSLINDNIADVIELHENY